MGFEGTFLGVVFAVMQMVLLALGGMFLTRKGILDPATENRLAKINYYLFIPLYSAVGIAKSIEEDRLAYLGYIYTSFLLSVIVTTFLGLVYALVSGLDLRIIRCFVLCCAFGNALALPAKLVGSVCQGGGPLYGAKYCSDGQGYVAIGMMLFNILVWVISPPFIAADKAVCMEVRRKAYVVRHWYSSLATFMSASNFDEIPPPEPVEEPTSSQSRLHPVEKGKELEDPLLASYALKVKITRASLERLNSQYEQFLAKADPAEVASLIQQLPPEDKPFRLSCLFILQQILTPPLMFSILGIIIGLITPVKRFLFDPASYAAMFMETFKQVADMAVPVVSMLLGAKLAYGIKMGADINLNTRDLIAMMIIRLAIAPAIGLGFMHLAYQMWPNLYENRVLGFMMYQYWSVPTSIVMLSVFLIVEYYGRELAIIQVWMNIAAIAALTLFLFLYFILFS
jgi:predicted permease